MDFVRATNQLQKLSPPPSRGLIASTDIRAAFDLVRDKQTKSFGEDGPVINRTSLRAGREKYSSISAI